MTAKIKILTLGIFLVFIDQSTKFIVSIYKFWGYAENPYIAFGIPLRGPIQTAAIIILLAGFIVFAKTHINLKKKWNMISATLIISGAVSNIIDRIIRGSVIDFISIWIWPVFNMADSMIVAGVIMLIMEEIKANKKK